MMQGPPHVARVHAITHSLLVSEGLRGGGWGVLHRMAHLDFFRVCPLLPVFGPAAAELLRISRTSS